MPTVAKNTNPVNPHDSEWHTPCSDLSLRSEISSENSERHEQDPCHNGPLLRGEIERRARAVLRAMSDARPAGSARWYPGPRTLEPIIAWAAVVPLDELLEHARGACALVAAGREERRWLTPWSVFGPRSYDRWAQAIAEYREVLEASETRRQQSESPSPTRGEPLSPSARRLRDRVLSGQTTIDWG